MQSGVIVAVAFLAGAVAIGIYDVFCIFSPSTCDTASHYLQLWSKANPLIPLLSGVLIGHLFFGSVCSENRVVTVVSPPAKERIHAGE